MLACAPLWRTPEATDADRGPNAVLGGHLHHAERKEWCPCRCHLRAAGSPSRQSLMDMTPLGFVTSTPRAAVVSASRKGTDLSPCHTSTSSPAASLAKTSPTPAKAPGSMGNARVFGQSTPDSFASYDPATSSPRTSQDSFVEATSSTPATDAYAAGLIDGEGCMSLDKKYTLRIDVGLSSKGLPILEWLVAHYGGTIRNTRAATEKWEAAQAWMLLGDKAVSFLRQIAPHLILKAPQAGVAIAFGDLRRRLPKTKTGRVRWTEDGRAEAQRLRETLMALNRKGPSTSESCAGDRIALLVGERWVSPQLDLLSEAGLMSFSETWPRAGMTRNGTAYRLQPLAPLTAATGSGSSRIPTPTAGDAKSAANLTAGRSNPDSQHHSGTTLTDFTRMWPTPTARDWKDTGDLTGVPENSLLPRVVDRVERESWPTPTANDARRGAGRSAHVSSPGPNLRTAAGGSLNPTWVEWLMGFPPGWTDSEASGTP
jgi:hypothetical protein